MTVSRTATARPFEAGDVQRLIDGEALRVYREEFPGLYTGMRATMKTGATGRATQTVFRVRVEDGQIVKDFGGVQVDREDPVGTEVSVNLAYDNGSFSGATYFTSEEAAYHYWLKGNGGDAGAAMERVAADRDLLVDDPDGEPIDLIPLYGSKVTLTVYVEDEENDEALREQVEALLREHFPSAAIPKIKSTTVLNERVTLRTMNGEPLATNVLADTTGVYTQGRSSFNIERLDPRAVPGKDVI